MSDFKRPVCTKDSEQRFAFDLSATEFKELRNAFKTSARNVPIIPLFRVLLSLTGLVHIRVVIYNIAVSGLGLCQYFDFEKCLQWLQPCY